MGSADRKVLGYVGLWFVVLASFACLTACGGAALEASPTQTAVTSEFAVSAQPSSKAVTLTWGGHDATSYRVYYSTSPTCDVTHIGSCPGGRVENAERSPYRVGGLTNGQFYYFTVQANQAAGGSQIAQSVAARPDVLAMNGSVLAMNAGPDGTVYLGGEFTMVGARSGGGVRFTTGGRALALTRFPSVAGKVYAATSDGVGGFYVGGQFSFVGGVSRRNLAHILADGSVNLDWDPRPNGTVFALAIDNGAIYAGGEFTALSSGGKESVRNRLASVGVDGAVLDWDPNADAPVRALSISDGTIFAGGEFTKVGPANAAVDRKYLVAVGSNGVVKPWNPNPNNTVLALAVGGATVYAGGTFTKVGVGTSPITRNNLAGFSAIDGTATSWDPNVNSSVSVLLLSGSTLFAGGDFTSIGSGSGSAIRNRLAMFDIQTGTLTPWNPGANAAVTSLAIEGERLLVGGKFTTIGLAGAMSPRNNLAAFEVNGSLNAWRPEVNGAVSSIHVSQSSVYVGGEFTAIGAVERNYLAAVSPDGELLDWNPGANDWVRALTINGPMIYVGGDFTKIGGTERSHLAALNSAGSLESWNPNANDWVKTLLVMDNLVYVGGDFTEVSGIGRGHLAAITSDGTLAAWNPNVNDSVRALAVTGATIYIGGDFTSIGNGTTQLPRNRLAAVDIKGAPSAWNPNADGQVKALATNGSTIYVGGEFKKLGSATRNYLAAVDAGGGPTAWNPNADDAVYALAIGANTVYAGGNFTKIGSAERYFLAAIDISGVPTNWDPDPYSWVDALFLNNSNIHVGGGFTIINSVPAGYYSVLTR